MNKRKTGTPWKKSRTFGDIYGGRMRLKVADGISKREHTLEAPSKDTDLPIFIQDNPSKDFYFPVTQKDVCKVIRSLPEYDVPMITHVWLRRVGKKEYDNDESPLAEYICGSGVYLVTIYPWPKDNLLRFGTYRPLKKVLKHYSRWTTNLVKDKEDWCLKWENPTVHDFYMKYLLYHELGHHVDFFYSRWSMANTKKRESMADQYAVIWSHDDTVVHK